MYSSKLINEGVTEKVTVTLIDTEREKEINLGAEWPYKPLGVGECIVNKVY
jgi:hypothetical protein